MPREIELKTLPHEQDLRAWCRWKRFTDAAGRRRGVGWILNRVGASASMRAVYVSTEGHCEHWRLEVAQ